MTTPEQFVNMRAPSAYAIECAIDKAIEEAAEQGRLDVEIKVEADWRGLEQVLRGYRRAGWKVTHYMSGLDVLLKFEVH